MATHFHGLSEEQWEEGEYRRDLEMDRRWEAMDRSATEIVVADAQRSGEPVVMWDGLNGAWLALDDHDAGHWAPTRREAAELARAANDAPDRSPRNGGGAAPGAIPMGEPVCPDEPEPMDVATLDADSAGYPEW